MYQLRCSTAGENWVMFLLADQPVWILRVYLYGLKCNSERTGDTWTTGMLPFEVSHKALCLRTRKQPATVQEKTLPCSHKSLPTTHSILSTRPWNKLRVAYSTGHLKEERSNQLSYFPLFSLVHWLSGFELHLRLHGSYCFICQRTQVFLGIWKTPGGCDSKSFEEFPKGVSRLSHYYPFHWQWSPPGTPLLHFPIFHYFQVICSLHTCVACSRLILLFRIHFWGTQMMCSGPVAQRVWDTGAHVSQLSLPPLNSLHLQAHQHSPSLDDCWLHKCGNASATSVIGFLAYQLFSYSQYSVVFSLEFWNCSGIVLSLPLPTSPPTLRKISIISFASQDQEVHADCDCSLILLPFDLETPHSPHPSVLQCSGTNGGGSPQLLLLYKLLPGGVS